MRFFYLMKTLTNHQKKTPAGGTAGNDDAPARQARLNELMNHRLADAVDLQLQVKHAHWNAKEPRGTGLHELFGHAAQSAESYVDMIARRIVVCGGVAEGTLRVSAARSLLREYPRISDDSQAHARAVARALADFGRSARGTIKEAMALDDAGTAKLFAQISRGADQWLGYLQAHALEAQPPENFPQISLDAGNPVHAITYLELKGIT
jgi:starvation-inducible DNA-binding protein